MTAVEFFFNELQKMQYFIGNDMLEAYKQAKEMEKQQMCQFAFDYQDEFFNNGKVPPIEQYYNETYGSKGSETKTN